MGAAPSRAGGLTIGVAIRMRRDPDRSDVLPELFIKRYAGLVDDRQAFFDSLRRPLPRSFRINRLKAAPPQIIDKLAGYGITCRPVAWYADAFTTDSDAINDTLEGFLGQIYLQELVSMLPPLVVQGELKNARRALDACAAPGSKSTQMAALMNNRGTLVANDRNYSRIRALKFNLNRAGVLNVFITNRDLLSFPQGEFEVILLDAPCSSEGTVRKNPDLLLRWSEHMIRSYASRQRRLIVKAFDLLASGGVLVYSTCTLSPEENEAVIDWLLENRPARLIPVSIAGFTLSQPLEEWQGQQFHPDVKRAVRVWPHHNDTGGFFMARIAK